MKRSLTRVVIIGIALALASPVWAQSVDAQVQKVDEAASKVTLKHGPIPKFDMGEMTMVYRVKDPAMLKGVNAGDKVKFDADQIDGKYTVTAIHKAR